MILPISPLLMKKKSPQMKKRRKKKEKLERKVGNSSLINLVSVTALVTLNTRIGGCNLERGGHKNMHRVDIHCIADNIQHRLIQIG